MEKLINIINTKIFFISIFLFFFLSYFFLRFISNLKKPNKPKKLMNKKSVLLKNKTLLLRRKNRKVPSFLSNIYEIIHIFGTYKMKRGFRVLLLVLYFKFLRKITFFRSLKMLFFKVQQGDERSILFLLLLLALIFAILTWKNGIP